MHVKLWSNLLPDFHDFCATEDDAEELRAHASTLSQKGDTGTGNLIESIQSLSLVNTQDEGEKCDDAPAKNRWTEPPAQLFLVRGTKYLSQTEKNVLSLKQPSAQQAYSSIGLQMFKSSTPLSPAAEKITSLRRFLQKSTANVPGDAPQFIVFCFYFSNFFRTEYTYVVNVFQRRMKIDSSETGEDPALDRAFSRFLKCSHEKKLEKFKFMARIRESATVKSSMDMMGGESPVLIGKRLNTKFFQGDNYLEIDIDCCSSTPATMMKGIVFKCCESIVIDYGFCIEGQSEDELPERMLCAMRFDHCNHNEITYPLDENGDIVKEA